MATNKNKKTTIYLSNTGTEESIQTSERKKKVPIKHATLDQQKKSKPTPIESLLVADDQLLNNELVNLGKQVDIENAPLLNSRESSSQNRWNRLVLALPLISGKKPNPILENESEVNYNPFTAIFWKNWNNSKSILVGSISLLLIGVLTLSILQIFASDYYKPSNWFRRDELLTLEQVNQTNLIAANFNQFQDPTDVKPSPSTPSNFVPSRYTSSGLQSRSWVEYTSFLIQKNKSSQPEAARAIAYATTTFNDVYKVSKNLTAASYASNQILDLIFPNDKDTNQKIFEYLSKIEKVNLNPEELKALENIINREKSDRFNNNDWDGIIPEGTGKYKNIENTLTAPTARNANLWLSSNDYNYNLGQPIPANSPQYNVELAIVQKAVTSRTEGDILTINSTINNAVPFPSILQNKLFELFKDTNPKASEDEISQLQALSSQVISDSYTEAWQTKYTHWTERPAMADPKLDTIGKYNDSPSFVAATVVASQALADVLNAKYKEKANQINLFNEQIALAELKSGSSFPQDIKIGKELGIKLAANVIRNLKLSENSITPEIIGSKQLQPLAKDTSGEITTGKDDGFLYIARSSTSPEIAPFVFTSPSGEVQANSGWTIEKVARDPFWFSSANQSIYKTLRNRYVAVMQNAEQVGNLNMDPFIPKETQEFNAEKLYLYDLFTKKYYTLFDNKTDKLGEILNFVQIGEDAVGIIYRNYADLIDSGKNDKTKVYPSDSIRVRKIEIPSFKSIDYKIKADENYIEKVKYTYLNNIDDVLVMQGQTKNSNPENDNNIIGFAQKISNNLINDGQLISYSKIEELYKSLFQSALKISKDYDPNNSNEFFVYDTSGKVVGSFTLDKGKYPSAEANLTGNNLHLLLNGNTPSGNPTYNLAVYELSTSQLNMALQNSTYTIIINEKEYQKPVIEIFYLGQL